jgi:hypothetical protein
VPIVISVNGSVVGTVGPGTTESPLRAPLPSRPWSVEARGPSGRVLAVLGVPSGDAASAEQSVAVFADLVCGPLQVWAGGPLGDHPAAIGATPAPCQ